MPETPEEGKAMMAEWNKWIEDNSDKFVTPGDAVGKSKTVSAAGVEDNGGANPLMGYSVVLAESYGEAADFAKTCPHLSLAGGSVEIAEIVKM